MTTLTLTRHFNAPPDKVFAAITRSDHLLTWWGPESMSLPEHDLRFDRLGPWYSVMMNSDGDRYKVSGQVTHVDPPHSVGFTWAWHDEQDRRGVESHVTMRLVPAQSGGTDFTLTHADLPDDDTAANHETGWTSSLRKLQALFA
ncbi:MAG: SRPBCC domain-containing protein [Marinibacterium sp.]|nr:SRPBCC domain-containing protein [Marinibacterium sp.]